MPSEVGRYVELPPLDEFGCDWEDWANARIRSFAKNRGYDEGTAACALVTELGQREYQLREAMRILREVDDFLIGWNMAAGERGYKAALDDYVTMELKAYDDPAVSSVAADRQKQMDDLRRRVSELERVNRTY